MAVVRDSAGRAITLAARTLVGRSSGCLLRSADRRVSTQHAAISWSREQWIIRDLGSRNGSFVNGNRIAPGNHVPLKTGARLAFANDEWTLLHVAAPVARAVCRDTAEVREGDEEDSALVLSERPSVLTVTPSGEDWLLEGPDATWRWVKDQEEIVFEGKRWTLELPAACVGSSETTEHERASSLSEATMRFWVSRDGEHVSVELRSAEVGTVKLPPRVHQLVLLVLARARLADMRGGVAAGECGWVYSDDLQRELEMDRTRVNLELHRSRKLLGRKGFRGADDIVERRASTQQLRIGLTKLEVVDE